ncbi:energy transducer TonB [Albibacterium bauzanense]|uniref:Outer membrane transport energization protein TonB n=1 Tax=Albibacterium bauzanense TaxID=653929 RepID=A0A4R1LZP3_9SPHI|nr:energy transducer TonB [Albibacterium bauzanense]TCK82843.1 outer membrane transport energization protein TonB [Albibacterium bauzanense]
MFGSKLDIFKKEWLELVFAGRNKAYGAYQLRQTADTDTTKALFIGVILFLLAVSSPMILSFISSNTADDAVQTIETEVVLSEPPPVDEEAVIPPPIVEPPPPRVDQVRMPPPVVVEAAQVRDEEPPTVEQLKVADPGPKTVAGDPTAAIRIDLPVGEGPKDQEVTEDVDHVFTSVEVAPTPQGGLEEFYKYVGRNYNYPAQAQEQGVSGRVLLQFVVERDGSLTDIQVLRDLKYGTGEEAVRMLKRAPKWKPGIQNGRPVRVQFTLPIQLNLAAQ